MRGQDEEDRGEDLLGAARVLPAERCGDRIQSSSGIMTIRLIVMELGRFTRSFGRLEQSNLLSLLHSAGFLARHPAWSGPTLGRAIRPRKQKAGPIGPALIWCEPSLRVDAALLDGERHAVDGQHVGGDAVVDVVGLGVVRPRRRSCRA